MRINWSISKNVSSHVISVYHLKNWKNDIVSFSIYFIWYKGNMIIWIVAWINVSQLYRDSVAMRQPFAVYSAIFPAGIPPGPILSFSIIKIPSVKAPKMTEFATGPLLTESPVPWRISDQPWQHMTATLPSIFQSWTRSAFGFGSLAMLKRWAHAKALLQWSGVGFKQRALRGGFMALGRYIEIVISYAVLEEKN